MQFPHVLFPAFLSPMAGVTDVAFRALARQYGAGMTYTEFVSGTAVVRGNQKTQETIRTDATEKPVGVQLFGSSVQDVVAAAQLLEHDFDVIDMNCGCPAWKVIKTGAGSALLNDPHRIATFVNKIASAVSVPVTIKIRAGTDAQHINAVTVARAAEDAGAAAVAVHGRTTQQGYSGFADWDVIRQVKDAVNIPVIGNGDVFSPEDFVQKKEYSGVDFVLIARGAMGNPYIFKQIAQYVKKGSYDAKPSLEQFSDYLLHAERYAIPFSLLKTHAMQFSKGVIGGAKLRQNISATATLEEIRGVLDGR